MTDIEHLMKGVKSIDELVPLGPSGAGSIEKDLRIEEIIKQKKVAASFPEYLVRQYHVLHKNQEEIAEDLNKMLAPKITVNRYKVLRWLNRYHIEKKSMSEAKMASPKDVDAADQPARMTILRGDEIDAYMMLEATLQSTTTAGSLQEFVSERMHIDCTLIAKEIEQYIFPLTGHLPYGHNSRLRKLVVSCKFNLPHN